MSSTPMAGSRRAYPPTAISGPSASGTVTSWPDIRRPLKAAAPGSQPIVRANASVTSVSPMPVSRTKGVEPGDADGDGHEVLQVREGRLRKGTRAHRARSSISASRQPSGSVKNASHRSWASSRWTMCGSSRNATPASTSAACASSIERTAR